MTTNAPLRTTRRPPLVPLGRAFRSATILIATGRSRSARGGNAASFRRSRTPERRAARLDALAALETESTLLGVSAHLLTVARRVG
jgi:hypothetical protein